jgi:hypothetical protein
MCLKGKRKWPTRRTACHAGGHGFESLPLRHKSMTCDAVSNSVALYFRCCAISAHDIRLPPVVFSGDRDGGIPQDVTRLFERLCVAPDLRADIAFGEPLRRTEPRFRMGLSARASAISQSSMYRSRAFCPRSPSSRTSFLKGCRLR